MGRDERNELACTQSSEKSTSISRGSSKPPLAEYGGENDEAHFKAKGIPKSHNVPHMIFSSTKELTKPKGFNFHDKRSKEIRDDEGDLEDDEAQVSPQIADLLIGHELCHQILHIRVQRRIPQE